MAEITAAETKGRAEPQPVVSEKSIAVLPFVNMSGDADQDFFADGLTEDILTELSRFRDLFVVARNSTLAWQAQG